MTHAEAVALWGLYAGGVIMLWPRAWPWVNPFDNRRELGRLEALRLLAYIMWPVSFIGGVILVAVLLAMVAIEHGWMRFCEWLFAPSHVRPHGLQVAPPPREGLPPPPPAHDD